MKNKETAVDPASGNGVDSALPRTRNPGASRQGKAWVGLVVGGAVLVVFAGWFIFGGRYSARKADALPVLFEVPDFSLVERTGKRVSRADLAGRIWIADFIFTNCAGPCPRMSLAMSTIQNALHERRADVQLVSFTLDPERDTPDVLTEYARAYGADPERWWFLTGDDENVIHELAQGGFRLAVQADPVEGGQLIHSTHFVLVDRNGRIRAYHEGLEEGVRERLLIDVDRLLREQPPR